MYLPSLLDGMLSQLGTQPNLASADIQNICVKWKKDWFFFLS